MSDTGQPTRVAILGGGIGAITTAFWLTSTPALRQRYAVSVYTHGWRLGGKCASGRDATQGNRIQEHGLHMLMGWYETAFQTIRACYAEWEPAPDNPFQTWRDAFTPLRQVSLTQQVPDEASGPWEVWNIDFPSLPGSPGDPTDDFLHEVVHTVLRWLHDHVWKVPDWVARHLPSLDPMHAAHARARDARTLPADQRAGAYEEILALLQQFQRRFERYVEPLLAAFPGKGYEICVFTDFALALLIGFIRDVLPDVERGLERLDELELRDWLVSAGANRAYVGAAPIRVLYDLAFAYADGDSSSIANGRIAAGSGLRALLRMTFAYKDAPLWKMNAGMGDTVFTPFYQVLRQRGVAVHFFHRVTNLGLSADGTHVDTVSLYRQVDLAGDYDPLVPVESNGRVLPCWPSHPKWEQIVDGERIAAEAWDLETMWCTHRAARDPDVTLRRGREFDLVVLGIPPAALKDIGAELLAPGRCPAIRAMVDHLSWVSTQATQVWLKPDLAGLGWTHGPTVLSTYADPFRSWGEMSHLLPMETWRWPAPAPGACEYFCGTRVTPAPLPPYGDRDFLRQQTEQVRQAFDQWLQANAAVIWPATTVNGRGFDRDLVVAEYDRVNLDPSEMYVQSFPGSTKYRLAPGASGVDNLFLAGDWTKGTVNGGCAEGAFESGKLAAQAICQEALPDLPLERLPAFVSFQGCGEIDYPAPLEATEDLLYAFALASDQARVQALVDATLAAPARGALTYHVLGGHVMLLFQHCGHFTSRRLGIGWAEDRETALMIPLIERRAGALSLPRLVLWMPYLMIDVGLGMVTGRDVWGYNKTLGQTTMPLRPDDPGVFACRTLVFDTFAAQTKAEVKTLIEVTRTDAASRGALTTSWTEGAGLLRAIADHLGPWSLLEDLGFAVDLLGLLLERDIPVINLKQMRDTRFTDRAVHQELVEAVLQVPAFSGAGLLSGTHAVKFRRCDSHRIVDQFGFQASDSTGGEYVTVPSKLACWAQLAFNADVGRTVWSSRRL